MTAPPCGKDHSGKPAAHRIVVCAEVPPDSDPMAESIDKIGMREALRDLLVVALPRYQVNVLANLGGGVGTFCRLIAESLGDYAPLHLLVHPLDKMAELTIGQDALLFVIGCGQATMDAMAAMMSAHDGRCLMVPVASTGGAALVLYERSSEEIKRHGGHISAALLDDLVYDALFRDILRASLCGFAGGST